MSGRGGSTSKLFALHPALWFHFCLPHPRQLALLFIFNFRLKRYPVPSSRTLASLNHTRASGVHPWRFIQSPAPANLSKLQIPA
ncbi:hypothetical protein LY76DRAFT_595251 [Colletotrichum caudatum]|nr:hypothetical protein LY76DRAFT_595251 [Colletotrichum caudatum]